MAQGVSVRTNLPDFKAQMRAFGLDIERKTVRAGTRDSARVFRDLVVQLAPVLRTPRKGRVAGLLKQAVFMKRSARSTRGKEHFYIGIRQGKRAARRKGGSLDAFYWRWVHEGHLARGPGGKISGGRRARELARARLIGAGATRVEGNPFILRAFQRGQTEALRAFTERMERRIKTENRKRR